MALDPTYVQCEAFVGRLKALAPEPTLNEARYPFLPTRCRSAPIAGSTPAALAHPYAAQRRNRQTPCLFALFAFFADRSFTLFPSPESRVPSPRMGRAPRTSCRSLRARCGDASLRGWGRVGVWSGATFWIVIQPPRSLRLSRASFIYGAWLGTLPRTTGELLKPLRAARVQGARSAGTGRLSRT